MTIPNQRQFLLGPFILVTSLFLLWGIVTTLNNALVPAFRDVFHLDYKSSGLLQTFSFSAFFLVSLPANFIVKKLGYKRTLITGLALMSLGALIFIPASNMGAYPMFLLALGVVFAGITVLQVVANTYVSILGPDAGAATRLNISQGFASLGYTLGPIIGGYLLLDLFKNDVLVGAKLLYGVIAAVLAIIAVVFLFLELPEISVENKSDDKVAEGTDRSSAFAYPHLLLGVLGIFVYVGAEVSIGTYMTDYFGLAQNNYFDFEANPEHKNTAAQLVSIYWGSLMVGRFLGPIIMRFVNAQRLTLIFGVIAALLVFISVHTTGATTIYTLALVGLFNSILFANIFTLSIAGLGKHTSFGSSLLIMAIVGGAAIPYLQGFLADIPTIGLKLSYLLPVICYLYIAWYGLMGYRIGQNKN